MQVTINALKQSFAFEAWEYIHTEISRKHEERDLQTFAETADAELITTWSDSEQNFLEVLYEKL